VTTNGKRKRLPEATIAQQAYTIFMHNTSEYCQRIE